LREGLGLGLGAKVARMVGASRPGVARGDWDGGKGGPAVWGPADSRNHRAFLTGGFERWQHFLFFLVCWAEGVLGRLAGWIRVLIIGCVGPGAGLWFFPGGRFSQTEGLSGCVGSRGRAAPFVAKMGFHPVSEVPCRGGEKKGPLVVIPAWAGR